jgi:hypothetical protein
MLSQLVVDTALNSLPRRTTDGSFIMRAIGKDGKKACVYKLNVKETNAILVQRQVKERILKCFSHVSVRPSGLEKQIRMHCRSLSSLYLPPLIVSLGPRCNLTVAYKNERVAPFVYILKGALSLVQGQVPEDAFEE